MVAKIVVLSLALVVCQASPVWFDGSGYYPGVIFRTGRSPLAYAYGSGFSTNIGGISHSTSIGSSFQSGGAEAYGGGVAGTGAGVYARGVGVINAAPYAFPLNYNQAAASAYNGGLSRAGYGSAVSSAQNYGANFGSAVSSAQTHNGFGAGPARYQSAASAQNLLGSGLAYSNSNTGLGYGSAASSAQNAGGVGSAVSSVQTHNGYDTYNAAVSAAENVGGYGGSTSQVVQQRAGSVQHSGASSINGPGVQAAHSHAVNNGYY